MPHAAKRLGITGLRANKVSPAVKVPTGRASPVSGGTKAQRTGKQFRLPTAIRPFLVRLRLSLFSHFPRLFVANKSGENNNRRRPNGSQTMSKHGGNDRTAVQAT